MAAETVTVAEFRDAYLDGTHGPCRYQGCSGNAAFAGWPLCLDHLGEYFRDSGKDQASIRRWADVFSSGTASRCQELGQKLRELADIWERVTGDQP